VRDAETSADLAALAADGYVVIPSLLDERELAEVRAQLRPHLGEQLGRNNFEGYRTERVYSLVGRGEPFARQVEHPRVLALCDALLQPNYLLTASQAICIHPGETPQPFHTDDTFYPLPRPRPAVSVSTIWAIDPFTAENGATQIVPGSHLAGDDELRELLAEVDFRTAAPGERTPLPAPPVPPSLAGRVIDAVMPAGSVIVFLGTLVHRGGANRSTAPRLAISHQYCQPWARQQESFLLSIPLERARQLSPRVQALLGYSIHPPFMGHADGAHPMRKLAPR
jgi:ectoine hydroxylase-related dioxygenase (phytanoyl-CoA dioxygenase family)